MWDLQQTKSAKCHDYAISSSFFSCLNGTYDLFTLGHSVLSTSPFKSSTFWDDLFFIQKCMSRWFISLDMKSPLYLEADEKATMVVICFKFQNWNVVAIHGHHRQHPSQKRWEAFSDLKDYMYLNSCMHQEHCFPAPLVHLWCETLSTGKHIGLTTLPPVCPYVVGVGFSCCSSLMIFRQNDCITGRRSVHTGVFFWGMWKLLYRKYCETIVCFPAVMEWG